jgi:hypothetical protein
MAQYMETTTTTTATAGATPATTVVATEEVTNHHNTSSPLPNHFTTQWLSSHAFSSSVPSWYDSWRGTGAAVLGVVLGGGVYPMAYAQLDRYLPGTSWRTLIVKSALEIVTVGITVNIASLYGRASWQGTHSWSDVRTHVTTEIPHVTLMDAKIWFPYNIVAFGCIPIHIRPITTACVEAGWQTWISLRAHAVSGGGNDNKAAMA